MSATRRNGLFNACCYQPPRSIQAVGTFMTIMLKTLDQLPGVGTIEGPPLSFHSREVSAREIVQARVTAEVARYNSADELPARLRG